MFQENDFIWDTFLRKQDIIFIIQRVKARAIPCPHLPPTKGYNTVLVAQGGSATPGATKQLFPPDRVFKRIIYIYIYIYVYARSIESRDYIGRWFSFLVYNLWFKKKRLYFRSLMSLRLCSNRFLMLRNHTGMVVPRVFHSCWKLSTKSNLMHIAPWPEDFIIFYHLTNFHSTDFKIQLHKK